MTFNKCCHTQIISWLCCQIWDVCLWMIFFMLTYIRRTKNIEVRKYYQISCSIIHDFDTKFSTEFRSIQWFHVNLIEFDAILINIRSSPFHKYFVNTFQIYFCFNFDSYLWEKLNCTIAWNICDSGWWWRFCVCNNDQGLRGWPFSSLCKCPYHKTVLRIGC